MLVSLLRIVAKPTVARIFSAVFSSLVISQYIERALSLINGLLSN